MCAEDDSTFQRQSLIHVNNRQPADNKRDEEKSISKKKGGGVL